MARGYTVKAGLAGLVLALAGCADLYRNHGYVPADEDLARVELGDDQQIVAREVGLPTATGIRDDSGWYYVRSRWRTYAYRAPVEIDREVVAISFDDGGEVANIERFGLRDGNVVRISRRVTSSNTEGIGFLRQLLGNIGRFDASNFFGDQ